MIREKFVHLPKRNGKTQPMTAGAYEGQRPVNEVWFCRRPRYDSFFFGPACDGFDVFLNVGWAPDFVDTFSLGTTLTPPVLPSVRNRIQDPVTGSSKS